MGRLKQEAPIKAVDGQLLDSTHAKCKQRNETWITTSHLTLDLQVEL